MKYSIDKSGYVTGIGISGFDIEITDEPFGIEDAFCWRKNIVSGEWIYLPDITPVNKEITEVRYDWPNIKCFITIADQFRSGPHEFNCTGTWSDVDCQAAINSKFS